MNKQQTKILLTKILPKFIIIALVVSGIIAFFAIRILGANAEKEADEFWKNPKNKEKIDKAINSNSSIQENNFKQVRDIIINTFDWNIHKYDNGANPISVSYLTINKGQNEIYVMSMKGERFETLNDFADYQKKSVLENYTDNNIKFKERLSTKFKAQESLTDVFSINLKDKNFNVASQNFKYKNNYYHIQHYIIQDWEKMIGNIQLN